MWKMKFFASIILLCAVAVVNASPLPALIEERSCGVKAQRKAWHTLTDTEKLAYLDAEKCLMRLPAKLGLPGTRTRFDELQAAHAMQAEITHGVGAFLPFHRLLMRAHEYLLQTECGFNGTQPYWDEPLDAGKFSTSILLSPTTGFGGDGVGPDRCIADGPFAGYVNGIGPGHTISDHCIQRQVTDSVSQFAAQAFVDQCYALDTYAEAWPCIEGMPHAGGHGGVGLLMLDPIASPGDPIFYLHHTYLDKVWWGWQALNLPARLSDMTGRTVQDPCIGFPGGVPFPGGNGSFPFPFPPNGTFPGTFPPGPNGTIPFPPNGTFPGGGPPGGFPPGACNATAPSFPQNEGDPGNVTTLNHVLDMFGIVGNAPIKDVMDIQGGFLCYEYV